ncbi:MAG: poly-gamma-glutamate system protein [Candidatus Krumholzibacteriia bacterium]
MSWRLDNRRRWILLGLAVLALLLQALLDATRAPMRQRDYALKLAAAERAGEAYRVLQEHRKLDFAEVDLLNDPAGTGLIGPEFSQITNAQGNLESKLTGLNPNWAAVIVGYFRQVGLEPGDPVAVAVSGSFPGLNIGLYAAIEAMRLRPVVITSVGASMWGANDPGYTWLDMERVLFDAGVFTTRSGLASFGGGDDMGRGLSPTGRQLILEAAARNGVPMLESDNIEQAIARRMAFYEEESRGRAYRCYVNVGGGVASLGSSNNRPALPSGLSFELGPHNWSRKGTLVLFAERGVPVLHLLRVQGLAREHGLPLSPDVLPIPGEGEIFIKTMYRFPLALLALVVYCGLCVAILAPELSRGIFDKLPRRTPRTPGAEGTS